MGFGLIIIALAGAVVPGLWLASILDAVWFGGGFESGHASKRAPLLGVALGGSNVAFTVWLDKRFGGWLPWSEKRNPDAVFGILVALGAISGIGWCFYVVALD